MGFLRVSCVSTLSEHFPLMRVCWCDWGSHAPRHGLHDLHMRVKRCGALDNCLNDQGLHPNQQDCFDDQGFPQ